MKKQIIIIFTLSIFMTQKMYGQVDNSFGSMPPFTKWYQNPLGFSPIALHTANGIIIPTIAAGAVLVFTNNKTTLSNQVSIYNDIGFTKGYYGSFSNLYHNNFDLASKK